MTVEASHDRPHIRRLTPPDREAFRAHLLRLDPESLRLRFGSPVNARFIDSYAATATRIDTLIFGCFIGEDLRAAAELRGVPAGPVASAEAAFSVEKIWQARGLGTALMARIVAAAQNRGIRRLFMIFLNENERMRRVAKRFGAKLSFEHDQARGFVTAVLDWKR